MSFPLLQDIPPHERIFCNRSLNMASIKAIGFDMDCTLVMYKPYAFEKLIYVEMLQKLVNSGYPKEILSWEFDDTCIIRGLIIDKKRGNILKLDRYRYVKEAYHGFKKLSKKERCALYDKDTAIVYNEPDFAFLDTYFLLVEAFLFSKLVEYKDQRTIESQKITESTLEKKSYADIYIDVRKSLDLSHRDDNLKHAVASNPENYVIHDPRLPKVLESLRKNGKKLFILSNSLWDYVNPIMSYVFKTATEKGLVSEDKPWTDYFDFVMTGAQKPQFFSSKNLMYEVELKTGTLKNLPSPEAFNSKVYQGGNVQQFQKMLGVSSGSEILYVGDHIYGDILRSKKIIGWRTLFIISELEDEIIKILKYRTEFEQLENLRARIEALEQSEKPTKNLVEQEKIDLLRYHQNFHPIWGSLLKTGRQNSFFSAQMENYACLYTSHFANLGHYSPTKNFYALTDVLPQQT